jgi:hypothetical protein
MRETGYDASTGRYCVLALLNSLSGLAAQLHSKDFTVFSTVI